MISTRSPLRISLGGGGTDLPSYYREHGGFLIAGAIDRFVYVNVLRPLIDDHASRSKLISVARSKSSKLRPQRASIPLLAR